MEVPGSDSASAFRDSKSLCETRSTRLEAGEAEPRLGVGTISIKIRQLLSGKSEGRGDLVVLPEVNGTMDVKGVYGRAS